MRYSTISFITLACAAISSLAAPIREPSSAYLAPVGDSKTDFAIVRPFVKRAEVAAAPQLEARSPLEVTKYHKGDLITADIAAVLGNFGHTCRVDDVLDAHLAVILNDILAAFVNVHIGKRDHLVNVDIIAQVLRLLGLKVDATVLRKRTDAGHHHDEHLINVDLVVAVARLLGIKLDAEVLHKRTNKHKDDHLINIDLLVAVAKLLGIKLDAQVLRKRTNGDQHHLVDLDLIVAIGKLLGIKLDATVHKRDNVVNANVVAKVLDSSKHSKASVADIDIKAFIKGLLGLVANIKVGGKP